MVAQMVEHSVSFTTCVQSYSNGCSNGGTFSLFYYMRSVLFIFSHPFWIQFLILIVFSFILFIFSKLIYMFSLILYMSGLNFYVLSLIFFIFSQLVYIFSLILYVFSLTICIQSDLLYIQSTYMYSVSCYMYSVWSHIYSLIFLNIYSHLFQCAMCHVENPIKICSFL